MKLYEITHNHTVPPDTDSVWHVFVDEHGKYWEKRMTPERYTSDWYPRVSKLEVGATVHNWGTVTINLIGEIIDE